MSNPHPVPASLQADYEAIEAAVMETEKGRWFLAEYARRNRAADTDAVLSAIGNIERLMRRERRPDIDRIRLDIGEMKDAIERTKLEITQIKNDHTAASRFDRASNELDAIVSQTEQATSEILNAAEKIQEYAWTMREAGVSEEICEAVETLTTTIYMACSFQDLTGQRTQKVVHVLRYLETRIDAMIEIWGMDEGADTQSANQTRHMEITVKEQEPEPDPTVDAGASLGSNPLDTRPDAHLLNGPALEGEGIDQGQIDEMLFDSIAAETLDAEDEAEEAVAIETAEDAIADEADGADLLAAEDAAEEAAALEEDATALTDFDPETSAEILEAEEAAEEALADEIAAYAKAEADAANGDEEPDSEAIARATVAMEAAIETLQKVSEVVRPDGAASPAEEDPLARLTRAERQALFS